MDTDIYQSKAHPNPNINYMYATKAAKINYNGFVALPF